MNSFQDLLLTVWREACRHIEIRESALTLAEMLSEHFPLASLTILRFEPQAKSVAAVGAAPQSSALAGPLTCSTSQWRRLVAWSRSGEIVHCRLGESLTELSILAPQQTGLDLLAGPLMGSEGPGGAIVLAAHGGEKFLAAHTRMLKQLLEPFAVALDNDRRLHELSALREAAEADRRSLLTRLGRQDLSNEIVGADTGLRVVMERVALVATSDVPVLILGDTGTGKEVVARKIHAASPRAAGPFIRVNCGAIPAELIDSHLFGHEKGSFTGAADQRQGWFERADGGTLFLDEIGELPLAAQVRLLRVLQDHQIERVGGQQLIHVDVRIVAATHRDLATMVKAATFREDLWYRVNVFPVLLPPLHERREDIPALVAHFAQRAANRFGLPCVETSPAELQLLMDYPWPGNIRELGAVIDRAAILGNGKRLEVAAALGFAVSPSASGPNQNIGSEARRTVVLGEAPQVMKLDDAMRTHIESVLRHTRGKIEGPRGAAALLAINPHTLRARMRKLHIPWPAFRE